MRKKKLAYKPTRKEIKIAVEKFLKEGGEIRRIYIGEIDIEKPSIIQESEADKFLIGDL